MAQFPNTWKYCATCAFWTGARKSENYGQNVQVGSNTEKGQCQNRSCGWTGYQRNADQTCSGWQKWPVLK